MFRQDLEPVHLVLLSMRTANYTQTCAELPLSQRCSVFYTTLHLLPQELGPVFEYDFFELRGKHKRLCLHPAALLYRIASLSTQDRLMCACSSTRERDDHTPLAHSSHIQLHFSLSGLFWCVLIHPVRQCKTKEPATSCEVHFLVVFNRVDTIQSFRHILHA